MIRYDIFGTMGLKLHRNDAKNRWVLLGLVQMKEIDVMDSLEKICDPDSDEGSWIAKTDLQVQGAQLKLVDMDQVPHPF